jgi:hypothetical protein
VKAITESKEGRSYDLRAAERLLEVYGG